MNTDNKMATLLGGVEVEVTKLDGTKETVRVGQLKIRQFQLFLEATDDESKLVEILTGKDAPWVDSLTPQSHVAVIEKGEAVNADFFAQWFRRKIERQKKLMGEVPEAMLKLGLSASQTMLPK